MDQRRKRNEETAQTVSYPNSNEPLQISERTLRMLQQNTTYERNGWDQNTAIKPTARRGIGGHSMGGAVHEPSTQSVPQAQMNLYSALSAGASGNPVAMAEGPLRLYTPEEVRIRTQAQRQAQQNLNAGMATGGIVNPVAAAGAVPTTGDLAQAFRVDPGTPVPDRKLWRRTEEPAFNSALQTGQTGNPLFLAGASPTPIDLMRDHYNDRVPKPPRIGEQTFAEGGRFDALSGRTYFVNNGNPVWAQVEDLEGIGVLSDGSVVGHLSNDRFARPLYEIIKARDTGQMDPIDASERIDMLAWDMALQAYPEDDERSERVEAYKANLRRIKNRKLEYYDIPDVTEWFDELLQEETRKFFARAKQIEENGLRYGNPEQASQELLLHFIKKFKNGGEYDLKQSQQILRDHALFVYNGEIVSRDAFANILYGYIMKKAGYSDLASQRIAGTYQKWSGTSSPEWTDTDGDDPRDRQRIMEGIRLYLEREGA